MSKTTKEALGGRIEAARKHAKMSQEALAEVIGRGERTLYNYLGGRTQPKPSALQKIAAATGVNLHWLTTGEGEMVSDGLTEAGRHIGYELRDERGDVAVRVSIVMEVGKTRKGELRMFLD